MGNLWKDKGTVVVLAPPLPPFLRLYIFSNGSGLRAEWDRPFSMLGFPVTSYTLDVVNKTSGGMMKTIVHQSTSDVVTYDLLSSTIPSSCHNISFSVIATNSVGDSTASNMLTSGFPICKHTLQEVA